MIRLPEHMARQREVITALGIPVPGREIDANMDMIPSQIAAEMLRIGGYLAYLEYQLGQWEAARLSLHDLIEHEIDTRLPETNAKETIRVREARIIHESTILRNSIDQRSQAAATVEQVKGLRNAYRAQYDVLSRVLSAKGIEAEINR